jgi:acyl-CoA thioester hydrolase
MTKCVFMADTDLTGHAWHGSYLRWLEELRMTCLAQYGLRYADMVDRFNMQLVAADLHIRYAKPALLGDILTMRLTPDPVASTRVRIVLDSEFVKHGKDGKEVLLARIRLESAPVSWETGRVLRKWPEGFEAVIRKVFVGDGSVPQLPSWME